MKIYQINGCKISDDPSLLSKVYKMNEELSNELTVLLSQATDADQKSIEKKFRKLSKKFPGIPQVRFFLAYSLSVQGKIEEFVSILEELIRDRPDYFPARILLAEKYISDINLGKVKELLGEDFDLRTFNPNREVFQIDEALGVFKIAVLYYCLTQNYDKALKFISFMDELDPEHPDTISIHNLFDSIMADLEEGNFGDITDEEDDLSADEGQSEFNRKPARPDFVFPMMQFFYQNGFEIPAGFLNSFMKCDRDICRQDLNLMLLDGLRRLDYFYSGRNKNENSLFVLHALYLLAEMEMTESLENVLSFFEVDEEVLGFYLGDHLTETIWQVFFKLGKNRIELLRHFMFNSENYAFARLTVSEALVQIALHYPEKRQDVLAIYQDLLNLFLEPKSDSEILSDSMFLVYFDISTARFFELDGLVESCFNKGLYDPVEFESFQDYLDLRLSDTNGGIKYPIPIGELYEYLNKTFGSPGDDDENFDDYDDYEDDFDEDVKTTEDLGIFKTYSTPLNVEKIGRNDPCSCGSGKKYKKCCGKGN